MNNAVLPPGQAARLAVLLDALDGVSISSAELVSLTWLAGTELCTVENIAAMITRARYRASPARPHNQPTT
jgi:hypothetical protein